MDEKKPLLNEPTPQIGYGAPPPPVQEYNPPPSYDGQYQQPYQQEQQPQYPPPQQPAYQQPQYPPQQPAYQQPVEQPAYQQPVAAPLPPSQAVVVNNSTVVFGDVPMQMTCPHCQQSIITSIRYEPGLLTWISMGVLFLLGFLICCWIPLLINGLKDVVHSCPSCHFRCGVSKKLDF